MLHDPSHYCHPIEAEEIVLSQSDKDILRALAREVAEIATLPVHDEKANLWNKLNCLESERPMVWINEVCWNEMNSNDELTIRSEHKWAQDQEGELRRLIYQWRHFPADMIVSDHLTCPLAIHSTDFGIIEDVDEVKMDNSSDIKSRHFVKQINDFDDLEKIRMPVVTHNELATEYRYQAMQDIYQGIIPVRKTGQTHIWFTPWDYLVRWYGVQDALMDLVMNPDLIHAAVERLVDAWMIELDQFVEMNLLSLDNNNTRVGSGGYGYCDELPGADYTPDRVLPHNMWGCSNAQIFSEVSPQMHWDFAIEHDLKWMKRWGLNYYGCCEPLHTKFNLLKKIPNLRKVSISPWCNFEKTVKELNSEYVLSFKPSPAIFAGDDWHPERAREDIRKALDLADGKCHIEIIMKDISTVSYKPERLWEWSQIAMEEATK